MNKIFNILFAITLTYNLDVATSKVALYQFGSGRSGNSVTFGECDDGSMKLSGCSSDYCVYSKLAGDRQDMSNFVKISGMSLMKCQDISMIAAKTENEDSDTKTCANGSPLLDDCSSKYCIALKLPESSYVRIQGFLETSMMTESSADCTEDLCVAKCQQLQLIAARG